MVTHTNLSHRRTHNLLLISKLLNQQQQQSNHKIEDASGAINPATAATAAAALSSSSSSSPFTLILDTLEQTARPLINEYIRRAKQAKIKVIYLAFESTKSSFSSGQLQSEIETFISCHDKSPEQIVSAVVTARANSSSSSSSRKSLIIIDSVHQLCTLSQRPNPPLNLTAYLFSLIGPSPTNLSSQASLITVYHTDIPLPIVPSTQSYFQASYNPSPLSLLRYLATTIFTVHSLPTLLAARIAQERSQVAPTYGLSEEREGIVIGLKPSKFSKEDVVLKDKEKGIVLELEHRRKSGRGVREWYFLPSSTAAKRTIQQKQGKGMMTSNNSSNSSSVNTVMTLLDDHPQFRKYTHHHQQQQQTQSDDSKLMNEGLTFDLTLTDRQKLERDGVVLPYFDAQRKDGGDDGSGNGLAGGRILYDMGSEDDFDEEEDEI